MKNNDHRKHTLYLIKTNHEYQLNQKKSIHDFVIFLESHGKKNDGGSLIIKWLQKIKRHEDKIM